MNPSSPEPCGLAVKVPSIAIVSINYEPELTGIAVYTTGMAEYLAENGHEVTVHTGFPYYPRWRKMEADQGILFRTLRHQAVTLRRCYLYVPSRPTAIRRILHELSFACSATLSYLAAPATDVTIIVSPPLALGAPIALLARLRGSRSIFHVQDLQPDAAVNLGMLAPGLLTRSLFVLEKLTYRLVDRVSTIGEAMRARIVAKGIPASKVGILKNWADNEAVTPLHADQSFRHEWQLEDRFVVLYSGNLGVKQGLDTAIRAMAQIQHHRDLAMVIVGDGGEKESLVALAAVLAPGSVFFQASVARSDLGKLLATADISLIPQRPGVNDTVLPSKLGNLLCSKRPILVAASIGSELHDLVSSKQCGLLVEPGDEVGLAQAVLRLKQDSVLRESMANAGYAYASESLTKTAILARFVESLHSFTDPNAALAA